MAVTRKWEERGVRQNGHIWKSEFIIELLEDKHDACVNWDTNGHGLISFPETFWCSIGGVGVKVGKGHLCHYLSQAFSD